MDSFLCVVFCETVGVDCAGHLGPRHLASLENGPAHGVRLEIDAADGVDQCGGRRDLAFYAPWHHPLDGLSDAGCGPIRAPGSWPSRPQPSGETNLPIC